MVHNAVLAGIFLVRRETVPGKINGNQSAVSALKGYRRSCSLVLMSNGARLSHVLALSPQPCKQRIFVAASSEPHCLTAICCPSARPLKLTYVRTQHNLCEFCSKKELQVITTNTKARTVHAVVSWN